MKKVILTIIGVVVVFISTLGGKAVEKVNFQKDCKVKSLLCERNGNFPNSPLPLVIYKGAFKEPSASAVIRYMEKNNWHNFWKNGVYGFHHYHSTAHEVLVCYRGSAKVQFGGPDGKILDFEKGDAVIIPAGVAHKKIESSLTFAVLGGYPAGQYVDMKYGKAEELAKSLEEIKETSLPKEDPVFGGKGKLAQLWKFPGSEVKKSEQK